jgi:major membrane immunogen (membrane-anchored lipoprotein)
MKNISLITNKVLTSSALSIVFRNYATPFVFALLTLAGCGKDDDENFDADIAMLVGTYSVVDTDEDDEIKNYDITITKADGGVEISNFGKIMYVPVKATIHGNAFHIPSQTFKGKSMTIVISGQGTLDGTKLNFDYVIDTAGGYVLEHVCVATKSNI